jgi:hypothetical protein
MCATNRISPWWCGAGLLAMVLVCGGVVVGQTSRNFDNLIKRPYDFPLVICDIHDRAPAGGIRAGPQHLSEKYLLLVYI